MVEFALIAPLFFAIVFGGIEIGLAFRSYLALENLSRSAARIGSIERDSPNADEAILQRIADLTAPIQGDVTKVIVFNAPTLDAEVPPLCISGNPNDPSAPGAAIADVCNSYNVVDGDVEALIAVPDGTAIGWPSASRGPGIDNIGIYIELEYQFATGFFDTMTLSTTTIEAIEQDI